MEKLFFLGTCAADFSQKLKNECANCFDKDARRASCALLDNRFLIDCGPHCLDSLRIAGIDMTIITDVFLTHLHDDHFNPDNLQTIASARAAIGATPLRIWFREDADFPTLEQVELHRMKLYERYAVTDTLFISSTEANHAPKFFPQWLLFEENNKKMLYATDGGWIMDVTYQFLRNAELSTLIMDATCGDDIKDDRMAGHNSLPMIRLLLHALRHSRMVVPETNIVLTHLAPSLHRPHAETVQIVEKDGFVVAYDGLTIDL